MSEHKIIEGLKQAVAGEGEYTIKGQTHAAETPLRDLVQRFVETLARPDVKRVLVDGDLWSSNFGGAVAHEAAAMLTAAPPSPTVTEEELERLVVRHVGTWIKAEQNLLGVFPTAARQDARDLARAVLSLIKGKAKVEP